MRIIGCLLPPLLSLPLLASEPESGKAAAYNEAFKAIPELSKQGQALLRQWADVPFDTSVDTILAAFEPSLQKMHEAVTAEGPCDWGIDLEAKGLGTAFPQVGAAHMLARAAFLRARRSILIGRMDWAMSDVHAVRRMARDIASTEVINTVVGCYAIEKLALEFLRDQTAAAPVELRRKLLSSSRRLGAVPSASTAVHQERAYYRWLARKLDTASKDGRLAVDSKTLFERLGVPQSFQQLQSFEETWKTDLKQAYDLQGQLAELAAGPSSTRLERLEAFEAQRSEEGWSLLAQLMVPNAHQLCEDELEVIELRRTLEAALAP